ncbi:helix-turn-helix domain-containing protein [Streptomyces flaveolus]|uniref:telomere-associated protein Tap n=1 Tax=Streptomyces flaveolus TaxID=67297 RepID=UPI00331BDE5D
MSQRKQAAEAQELFELVDALLEEEPVLPPPPARAWLREQAGVPQARLAAALKTTVQTVKNYESGRSEPRPPRDEAYRRALEAWARRYLTARFALLPPDLVGWGRSYMAHLDIGQPATVAALAPTASVPATSATSVESVSPAPAAATADVPPAAGPGETAPASDPAPAVSPTAAPPGSGQGSRPAAASSRRPVRAGRGPATAAAVSDPRYAHGPLLVLDADGDGTLTGFGRDGLVVECPARTVAQLVAWTLDQPVGAPPLNRYGRPSDPLVVLTAAAAVRLGLPERLEGHEQRKSLRLPEDHPVVKQITRAKWQLTRRGFGPWARIYRPATAGQRQCVQLALLSWDALEDRSWPGVAGMQAPEVARVLTQYADRVLTPRGKTAVNGLELMTALRPPTRPVRDMSTVREGGWVSTRNPGSLGTEPVDPAPPEAVPEHPLAQDWNRGFLDEEVFGWVRDVDLVGAGEASQPYAIGLDVNSAFLAAASRTPVGLCAPQHVMRPRFDKKVPGCWLVDLSRIDLDPRLPNPFTPSGERPTGPAWYETHTVAYAVELGHDVAPLEAYLRHESGAYLDPWHDRLKSALLATMEDLGVTAGMPDHAFLAAMDRIPQGDPAARAVLAAIKATAKGGIGKLRSRARGVHYVRGERWPELERPTWRPDIRAAVISKARINMHRKMRHMAGAGLFPLGVLSDCVVYPAPTDNVLDLLPRAGSGKPLPGAFRLGVTPGLVKVEGVQTMAWAVDLIDQGGNPAQLIKGTDAVLDDGE